MSLTVSLFPELAINIHHPSFMCTLLNHQNILTVVTFTYYMFYYIAPNVSADCN
jgi:hypothetical protein